MKHEEIQAIIFYGFDIINSQSDHKNLFIFEWQKDKDYQLEIVIKENGEKWFSFVNSKTTGRLQGLVRHLIFNSVYEIFPILNKLSLIKNYKSLSI